MDAKEAKKLAEKTIENILFQTIRKRAEYGGFTCFFESLSQKDRNTLTQKGYKIIPITTTVYGHERVCGFDVTWGD